MFVMKKVKNCYLTVGLWEQVLNIFIIIRKKCIIVFGQNLVILIMVLWRDPYALCGPQSGAKRPEQQKTCLERPVCRVCTLYIVCLMGSFLQRPSSFIIT